MVNPTCLFVRIGMVSKSIMCDTIVLIRDWTFGLLVRENRLPKTELNFVLHRKNFR